jgi:hypothetical protein
VKYLLLDANVIIHACELGVWDKLVAHNEIMLAATIRRDETLYYYVPKTGEKVYLNLTSDSRIQELSVETESVDRIRRSLPRSIELHEGELESLAILCAGSEKYKFCTADRAAIQALVLFDHAEQGLSFEKLLVGCGLTRKVDPEYSEARFRWCVRQAAIERVQRPGGKKR